MSRAHRVLARLIGASLILSPAALTAQLANASNAATALSGAYTARAQGYNAVYWNPANLAMPGTQGFSFGLIGFDGNAGIKPIDFNKLAPFSGKDIPKATREEWMLDVERDGGQKGAIGAGVTGAALSLGHIGFQVSTKVATDMNLAPGAVEAIMFGNTGRYDTVRTLSLAGSSLQAAAYTTGAISYGMSLPMVPLANFAVGATVKYTLGHGVLLAQDAGSSLGTNSVSMSFPAILPNQDSVKSGQVGKGIGVDIGAAWKMPGMRVGVSLQNVVNSFKWDTTQFVSRNASGLFASDTNYFNADSVDQPYASAPAALRERLAGLVFKPVLAAGLEFDLIPRITVSADIRQQVGDGLEVGPKSVMAAGAELRIIPFIPLRGGVQLMSGGVGVSGGLALHVLGFEAGIGGFVRKRDGGSESGVTFNAFSIRP
jgi:hypothetical protein